MSRHNGNISRVPSMYLHSSLSSSYLKPDSMKSDSQSCLHNLWHLGLGGLHHLRMRIWESLTLHYRPFHSLLYIFQESEKTERFFFTRIKQELSENVWAELKILSHSIIPHLSSLKWGIVGHDRLCIGWMAFQNVDCARAILYELEKRFLIKTCLRWGFR